MINLNYLLKKLTKGMKREHTRLTVEGASSIVTDADGNRFEIILRPVKRLPEAPKPITVGDSYIGVESRDEGLAHLYIGKYGNKYAIVEEENAIYVEPIQ